ncbi:MAG TPA: (2Fe-2S)-binding protein [Pseudolabrys sp.]|nr:(2Fe-2S)-binding protein [Pseudolabrys sp.]
MSTLQTVRFTVNGKAHEAAVEPRTTLADCLRHDLKLTGTHVGCEHGVCGACTVIVEGAAVRACLMFAVQADGMEIMTVEGLSDGDALSPLQASFRRHHALQCGFCTAGILTTAHVLLSEEPDADAERIREVLSGNICRCTGYVQIIEAVLDARAAYQTRPEGAR